MTTIAICSVLHAIAWDDYERNPGKPSGTPWWERLLAMLKQQVPSRGLR